MNNNFSDLNQEGLQELAQVNYPKPADQPEDVSWVFELRLHRLDSTKLGFPSFVVGGTPYDACLDNFAKDLAKHNRDGHLAPKRRFEILIYPGKAPWWDNPHPRA